MLTEEQIDQIHLVKQLLLANADYSTVANVFYKAGYHFFGIPSEAYATVILKQLVSCKDKYAVLIQEVLNEFDKMEKKTHGKSTSLINDTNKVVENICKTNSLDFIFLVEKSKNHVFVEVHKWK